MKVIIGVGILLYVVVFELLGMQIASIGIASVIFAILFVAMVLLFWKGNSSNDNAKFESINMDISSIDITSPGFSSDICTGNDFGCQNSVDGHNIDSTVLFSEDESIELWSWDER